MEPYYTQIRAAHIAAVFASGGLFLVRASALNLFRVEWPSGGWLRYLDWTLTTIFLTAALMLTTVVHQFPFVDGWLTVKALALVAYVVFGHLALDPSRSRQKRLSLSAAALAIFIFIVSVARLRNPLGFLSYLF